MGSMSDSLTISKAVCQREDHDGSLFTSVSTLTRFLDLTPFSVFCPVEVWFVLGSPFKRLLGSTSASGMGLVLPLFLAFLSVLFDSLSARRRCRSSSVSSHRLGSECALWSSLVRYLHPGQCASLPWRYALPSPTQGVKQALQNR